MNVNSYLARIGFSGATAPTADTLRRLHLSHMRTVPFENLDISLGREIVCDEDRFLHKIIHLRRGGFCYELNGAFAALLRSLGFSVTLLSARVSREDGSARRSLLSDRRAEERAPRQPRRVLARRRRVR